LFNASVTIAWSLFDVPEDAASLQAAFLTFTKCLRDWLGQRGMPCAYLYSHEVGQRVGAHTHIAVHIPPSGPDWAERSAWDEFPEWVSAWSVRFFGRPAKRAVRVGRTNPPTLVGHWLRVSYAAKGYDRGAVLRSAENSDDGRPVMLGDIIAWDWTDPGPVALRRRVGAARGLGPARRRLGVTKGTLSAPPPAFNPARLVLDRAIVDNNPIDTTARPRTVPLAPFRSKLEDGFLDVRALYGDEFCFLVDPRLVRTGYPTAPEIDIVKELENLVFD
jgi:hypothetical protein